MSFSIITIGREYGSGGRQIAQKLSEALGYTFYDKEIIALASKESGLAADFIQENEQKKTTSFLYNLYFNSQSLPISDQVFIAQSQVIREVAQKGNCIIVGRCADYILRERKDCLHVFIHAPMEQRLARIKEEYGLADCTKEQVLKKDKGRNAYYDHFTDLQWGRCQNYHMSINSNLGIDTAVELIRQAALTGEIHP